MAKPLKQVLSVDDVFKVGNLNIGWVDSDFNKEFSSQSFSPKKIGSFQKLGKYFSNAGEIEKELNPGTCELGDVYAFLQSPPEGTKDGWSNLFLVGDKVLSVYWHSGDDGWLVSCCSRVRIWHGVNRVFSPETSGPRSLAAGPLDTLTLPASGSVHDLDTAIRVVKKAGYVVSKIM